MDTASQSPAALWSQAFDQARQAISSPMIWLAMQAATPVTLDGNFFVVGLAPDKSYLATNLQTFEAVSAIEEALRDVSGRILAFRLIEGVTLDDWDAYRAKELASEAQHGAVQEEMPAAAANPTPTRTEASRDVSQTWEKLSERLNSLWKSWPLVKYPHGQARFVLQAVKHISDTMDLLMPPSGQPLDDAQERWLSKTLERLSGAINLDPIFIALELFRYRDSRGK